MVVAAIVAAVSLPSVALADDAVDTTVTLFQERRPGTGGLTVVHPQFDLGLDVGTTLSLNLGYEADVVSGATYAIYAAPRPDETIDVVSGATTFDDLRHGYRAGVTLRGRRSSLSVGYSGGLERDYRSHVASAGATVDLPGKNTTFAITYAHNFDQVCDRNNGDASPLERQALSGALPCFTSDAGAMTVSRDISIDTAQGTVTQNVSPTMVVQFGIHGQILDGFQSNPYRRVRVQGVDAQEQTPLTRARGALFARANIAFPNAHSALGVMIRGYSDTWGIESGSAEMTYSQYFGKRLMVRARARIYQQDGAVFFRDAVDYQNFGPPGAYFTGDRELSPMRDILVGMRLSYLAAGEDGKQVWGVFDEINLHAKADVIYANSLTTNAPGGDPTGTFPDQLMISLGLLLRY